MCKIVHPSLRQLLERFLWTAKSRQFHHIKCSSSTRYVLKMEHLASILAQNQKSDIGFPPLPSPHAEHRGPRSVHTQLHSSDEILLVLVLVLIQVLVLDLSSPIPLWFGLGTRFGPDSVHAKHLCKRCSVGCSVILPATCDKRPVLPRDTGLLRWLVMWNSNCM